MARKLFLITLIGFITVSIGMVWAGPQVNPGKWEFTTQTEMAGMPSQSINHVQCITADDMIPMSQDANQECQVTDIVYIGNTVTWEISCGGQDGEMVGTGSVTYNGNSMNGIMNMTITGERNIQVKNIMTGRRLGECDGSTPITTINSSPTGSSGNSIGDVVADDVKDVGKAAKDEAKQTTIDEVREEVRGFFKNLFD